MAKDPLTNPLGAAYWKPLHEELRSWAYETLESLRKDFMADGHPPFTEPLEPRAQYSALLALREANSPEYWNDPEAVRTLEQLSKRFGPPPAPSGDIPSYPGLTGGGDLLQGY